MGQCASTRSSEDNSYGAMIRRRKRTSLVARAKTHHVADVALDSLGDEQDSSRQESVADRFSRYLKC